MPGMACPTGLRDGQQPLCSQMPRPAPGGGWRGSCRAEQHLCTWLPPSPAPGGRWHNPGAPPSSPASQGSPQRHEQRGAVARAGSVPPPFLKSSRGALSTWSLQARQGWIRPCGPAAPSRAWPLLGEASTEPASERVTPHPHTQTQTPAGAAPHSPPWGNRPPPRRLCAPRAVSGTPRSPPALCPPQLPPGSRVCACKGPGWGRGDGAEAEPSYGSTGGGGGGAESQGLRKPLLSPSLPPKAWPCLPRSRTSGREAPKGCWAMPWPGAPLPSGCRIL